MRKKQCVAEILCRPGRGFADPPRAAAITADRQLVNSVASLGAPVGQALAIVVERAGLALRASRSRCGIRRWR